MSYFSAVLLNRLLVKNKKTVELEIEDDDERGDSMDKQKMAEVIVNMLEGKEPEPQMSQEYPDVGERIGTMLSQKMIGYDPMTKVKKLIDEANRHHPVDDTHIVQKVEVKRMDDGTNAMFVEWMKHTY